MCKLRTLLLFYGLFSIDVLYAQNVVEPTENVDKTTWVNHTSGFHVTWIDTDKNYPRYGVVQIGVNLENQMVTAWRGERIYLRAMAWGGETPPDSLQISLKSVSKKLRHSIDYGWQAYVLTTEWSGCGYPPADLPTWTVPDRLSHQHLCTSQAGELRPLWMTIEVPRNLKPGKYDIALNVGVRGGESKTLSIQLNVIERHLSAPRDYTFHLDLWQQPYAVSRFYGVKPWSQEHFELLKPYMHALARAGQKVISTILFYEPWGEQSNDKFEPMVETTKCKDGTWKYDYKIFDKYVLFMQECGISEQIDCYSMIPWDMNFRYWDEAKGDYSCLKTTTDTPEYRELWTSFLQSFAQHLREKGWFDKTCIAMDERGLADMQRAYQVAQEAVPGIHMALAGNRHEPLVPLLTDYAIAYGQTFTPEELRMRREKGYHSTMYTCCTESFPGFFSNSEPADAVMLSLHCIANDFDGYLHWSWINWTDDPMRDTRFRMFAPGDTYLYYPNNESSPRFERLIEGIQLYEKIRILGETPELKKQLDLIREKQITSEDEERGVIHAIESLVNQ